MPIKAGQIIVLETGEYSDKFIAGCFLAKRDISDDEWDALRAECHSGYSVDAFKLTAKLTERGAIEDSKLTIELHADDPLPPNDETST